MRIIIERGRQTGSAALRLLNKLVVLNRSVPLQVFEAILKSKLMYGGYIWLDGKKDIEKLETV
jgi:hypothetical protein